MPCLIAILIYVQAFNADSCLLRGEFRERRIFHTHAVDSRDLAKCERWPAIFYIKNTNITVAVQRHIFGTNRSRGPICRYADSSIKCFAALPPFHGIWFNISSLTLGIVFGNHLTASELTTTIIALSLVLSRIRVAGSSILCSIN